MSYKTVWKLCKKRTDGVLVSAVAWTTPKIAVEYYMNESVKPKVGLLFAFDTQDNAVLGRTYAGGDTILVKCKARISKRIVPEYVSIVSGYELFWKRFLCKKRYSEGLVNAMPPGTVFCTEVIPLEIVPDWRNS